MEPSLLRRHGQRGTYDIDSVKSVFEDCFLAHVAYVDDGLPICLPMIALVREEDPVDNPQATNSIDGDTTNGESHPQRNAVVYLHGHPSSRLMELVRASNRESSNGTETGSSTPKQPVKVCITATKVDGLVLSSAPNGHTFNYRAAVIHGTCIPVHDKAVKREVMHDVTNHVVASRWEEVNPVASFQVSLVYVIRVEIDKMSVKSRLGVPGIQPRDAEKDGPNNKTPPWTGVVPMWEQLGEPVESGLTPGAVVSKNLRNFIDERNAKHRGYSETVAS